MKVENKVVQSYAVNQIGERCHVHLLDLYKKIHTVYAELSMKVAGMKLDDLFRKVRTKHGETWQYV